MYNSPQLFPLGKYEPYSRYNIKGIYKLVGLIENEL